MTTYHKKDQNLTEFHICVTIVISFSIIGLLVLSSIYAQHCTNVATEALKAGLVQQKTSSGYIWVKPEDYKPYPLSPYDAPHWNK